MTERTGTLVVVTGSREWEDERAVWDALKREYFNACDSDSIRPGTPFRVMHGACKTGADAHASDWAMRVPGVQNDPMPAPWEAVRRSVGNAAPAGPQRNTAMTEAAQAKRFCGWHVVCHAFGLQQSRGGTRDMVRKLEAAGFEVTKHERGGGDGRAGDMRAGPTARGDA